MVETFNDTVAVSLIISLVRHKRVPCTMIHDSKDAKTLFHD